jgi:virginiamycin A acetyltransferase
MAVAGHLRDAAKWSAHAAACVVVAPSVLSLRLRASLIGADRALEGSTQAWAWVPGLVGQYVRRAFLSFGIARCARSATIEFGTIFSSAGARIDDRAYVGPRCHLGFVHIERDVLIAAGVHIPSGSQTHGSSDLSVPMRDQPGSKQCVRIGAGAWIGSGAVVMADVGCDTIVGAGAVVTRPLPDRVVAGGVPARVIRHRDQRVVRMKG